MSIVYRAYSPTRDEGTTVTGELSWAQGVAATRNQHAAASPGQPADWIVQIGHVRWGHLGTDGIDRSEGGKAATSD